MSLQAAKTCTEGIWQYCNYGYDKSKYTSFDDCMAKRTSECPMDANAQQRLDNLTYAQWGIRLLGSVAGAVYAHRTGGGFWRYVGFWLLGGIVAGITGFIAFLPFRQKILKESNP